MNYYRAENFGLGFILHTDQTAYGVRNYYGDVWSCTQNGAAWAARVGATELTADELQDVNDAMENDDIKRQIAEIEGKQARAVREAALGISTEFLELYEGQVAALRAQMR